MRYPDLDPGAGEPAFDNLAQLREHRKRRLALGYRIFGAMHYGSLGDGHITARDPQRTDHFWLARYGVPFGQVTVGDLVLVAPDGSIAEGHGWINPAAYYIHAPIHEARPDIVSAAHTHTPYGTPFAAKARLLEPISQESCTFFEDHALFDDEEVDIASTDGGKRIAAALGAMKAVILRNHGPLTVGMTVDAAVGFFLQLERAAEVHVKVTDATPISAQAARAAHRLVGSEQTGRQLFEWLLRSTVPDPDAVLTNSTPSVSLASAPAASAAQTSRTG
jgi:ribulose-5-phosphate 4-epimerase/fuculose-1-phosphate aldolase